MPLWIQHVLVIAAIAGAATIIGLQAFRAFRGRKGALGSCCAKGCDAGTAAKEPAGERIVFLPAELLTSSKRSSGGRTGSK